MKRIVIHLCFLPLLSVLVSGAAVDAAAVRQKIIVGGDHENPPYEYLANGRPAGFNIELMQAVAEVTGLELEFKLGTWHKVRQELEQGKLNVLAGMYYSEDRSRKVDFSVPHTLVTSGLIVRKGSPIASLEDIRGREIIVQKGDIIHDLLKRRQLSPHITALSDPADELLLLSSGRHDCVVMPSRFQGEYLVKELNLTNIAVINADLPQLKYCFAIRKGDHELKYRLDEGLNILKVSGKYRQIYEKWFGIYEKRGMWKVLRYFVAALALIMALLAATLVWSRSLRRQVMKQTGELHESEQKFRVLAETLPAGICLYQDERIVYVNAAAASLFEYSERECLEMNFWDWVHDDYKALVRERGLARQRGEPVPTQYECRHVTKNGADKWIFISAGPIEYRGKPAGIVTFFDITDRKRMEDELLHAHDSLEVKVRERTVELARAVETMRESERASRRLADEIEHKQYFLRTLIDSIPDLIFYKDVNSVYLGCNKAFEVFSGVGEKALVGRTDLDLFPVQVAELFREMDRKMLAEGATSSIEEWIDYPDGRHVLLETLKTPFRGQGGEILGLIGISRDITERKRTEEQLRRQKQQLEELNCTLEKRVGEEVARSREKDIMLIRQNRQAAMGEMLEHIAHQWKQPLTAVSLNIQNFWEIYTYGELTSDELKSGIDRTLSLIEHMAQTIDVFRDFYRPDKEKTVFSLKDSVDGALAFISPALKYESVAVDLDLESGLLVSGYPKEYTQVLLNILANAREAFRERRIENPKLRLKSFAEGNKAVLTITDNAGGIPEHILDRIFDLYVTSRESSGGTGIGLHMSKDIIGKNMGGELTAQNTDCGAQFRIAVEMPNDHNLRPESVAFRAPDSGDL